MVGFLLGNNFCPEINPLTKQEGCMKSMALHELNSESQAPFISDFCYDLDFLLLYGGVFAWNVVNCVVPEFFFCALFCLYFVNEQKEEALGTACCLSGFYNKSCKHFILHFCISYFKWMNEKWFLKTNKKQTKKPWCALATCLHIVIAIVSTVLCRSNYRFRSFQKAPEFLCVLHSPTFINKRCFFPMPVAFIVQSMLVLCKMDTKAVVYPCLIAWRIAKHNCYSHIWPQ